MRTAFASSIFLACWSAFGQTPAFEVASIKPAVFPSDAYFAGYAAAGTCNMRKMTVSGNRVTISMVNLCSLIRIAYDVPDFRITGAPAWMSKKDQSVFYEVQAEAAEALTESRAKEMLRTLPAERFQLKLHRDSKQVPIYALVVGKNGHKLSTEALAGCDNSSPAGLQKYGPGIGFTICKPTMSMARLAETLSPQTDRPVQDRTGLTGQYAFALRYAPAGLDTQPDSAPSLFTAIQEQLGLKLEPQQAPMELLVLDRAEPPTTN